MAEGREREREERGEKGNESIFHLSPSDPLPHEIAQRRGRAKRVPTAVTSSDHSKGWQTLRDLALSYNAAGNRGRGGDASEAAEAAECRVASTFALQLRYQCHRVSACWQGSIQI